MWNFRMIESPNVFFLLPTLFYSSQVNVGSVLTTQSALDSVTFVQFLYAYNSIGKSIIERAKIQTVPSFINKYTHR